MNREQRDKLRQKLDVLDVKEALASLMSNERTKDMTMEEV
jgi:hypothetical protein